MAASSYPELIADAREAVFVHDAAARILEVNDEACRSVGYSRDELLRMHVTDLVEGLDAAALGQALALLREQGFATFRAVHRRKDGTSFPVETRLALLRTGEPIRIVAFAQDLTRHRAAQHALEERLRQSEKLEALGSLASGVAHDFNNVLAAILGHADSLASDLPAGSPARADAEQISAAARRAKGVVQQILAFARRRPAEMMPVDVARAIEEELPLVRAATPATVEIVLRCDRRAGAVRADPTQIHQVLLNLCSNARDAMAARGGTLEIEVSRAEVPASAAPAGLAPGSYVRITVADGGPGMDAQTRARAFEPYFTTKPPGVGSGLGLPVVRGIATALGGAVTLDSVTGKGTRVEVWLPRLGDAATTPVPRRTPVPAAPSRRRVLLVDDDPSVARAIARMLELTGYDVATANDAETALERFRADPRAFDLVLTDETLPRMRGEELTVALLTVRPDVPVVICTGYSERLDDERARALGARALLTKPLDLRQLAETLKDAIGRE